MNAQILYRFNILFQSNRNTVLLLLLSVYFAYAWSTFCPVSNEYRSIYWTVCRYFNGVANIFRPYGNCMAKWLCVLSSESHAKRQMQPILGDSILIMLWIVHACLHFLCNELRNYYQLKNSKWFSYIDSAIKQRKKKETTKIRNTRIFSKKSYKNIMFLGFIFEAFDFLFRHQPTP